MKIIVPIKQVPESSNVKMDKETGTVIRTGVDTVVNPLDLYALEAALVLKERYGGEAAAISMGPPQAMRALMEAAAMGCDGAFLLSDRQFGGADTWATSYTLAQGIRKIGGADIIITGERATDGDTAQVGPGIAAWLDLPVASYVSKIISVQSGRIEVERLIEEGYQRVSLALPCVLTVVKEAAVPRLPTLRGKIRSMELEIPVITAADPVFNPEYLGLKGSPTRVVKIDTPKLTRGGRILRAEDDESLRTAVEELAVFLEQRGII
ncbi:MAG: electron transfer flavoprotein subunit beta/FixA family protein [Spirochaetaceae bacterium]|nr:electron transfer flavoprotein subunit beta/FixA family protein [Spirochaetaceae bacterium]